MVPWGRLLYVSVMGISNDLAHSSGPDIARYKFATYRQVLFTNPAPIVALARFEIFVHRIEQPDITAVAKLG